MKRQGVLYSKFFCELFNTVHPAVLLALDGEIIECSDAFIDLYRLNRSETLHKNFFSICRENEIIPPFQNGYNLQNHLIAQTPIIKKDNKITVNTIQWSASKIPIGQQKNLIFLLGFKNEFPTSSQDEHFIKTIIDRLPNHFIFWKDRNSVYLGCNQTLASALGFNSSSEIIGKTDYDLPTTKEQSEAYRADDKLVMQTGKPKLNIEETQTLSDGNIRILLTNKMPLFDEKGHIYGVLAIYSDITAQKELENSLKKAKEAAEAASRAKSEFIANMSHDIRTPLTGIIGMSLILEEEVSQPDEKEHATLIHASGEQLLGLLNGILDLIKADASTEDMICQESFDVRKLIHDIAELEHSAIAARHLNINVHIDEAIPMYVIGDRMKLHRILLNLMGNAIKFTKVGYIEINVQLCAKQDDDLKIQFSVKDTGIGIPEDLQDKVFDRFFKVSSSYKGLYTGNGIGLNIAQKYVGLLGGEIRLVSSPGVGTTFMFVLPMKIGGQSQQNENALLSDVNGGTTLTSKVSMSPEIVLESIQKSANPNRFQVLLVEDNATVLTVLIGMMKHFDVQVTTAVNVELAFELVKSQSFDLIITDVGLPGKQGDELTVMIRAFEKEAGRKSAVIIGYTGHAALELHQQYVSAGMNEICTKPMTPEKLRALMAVYGQ